MLLEILAKGSANQKFILYNYFIKLSFSDGRELEWTCPLRLEAHGGGQEKSSQAGA